MPTAPTWPGRGPGSSITGPLWMRTQREGTPRVSALTCVAAWRKRNVAATANDVHMTYIANTSSATTWTQFVTMPGPGSIVGVSVASNGTFSANAPRVYSMIAGVSKLGFTMAVGVTADARMISNLASYTYTAGQTVAIAISTASAAPTTRELVAWLWTT